MPAAEAVTRLVPSIRRAKLHSLTPVLSPTDGLIFLTRQTVDTSAVVPTELDLEPQLRNKLVARGVIASSGRKDQGPAVDE